MANDCKLTTFDNPFDPFEQFDSWRMFDIEKGHYSCEYLARIAKTTDDMSQKEYDEEIERAIDEIIANDFLCKFKKVTRSTAEYSASTDENAVDNVDDNAVDTETTT